MSSRALCLLLVAALATPGCAEPSKPAKVAAIAAGCTVKTASGLGYQMLTEGKGDVPGDADEVTVSYKGTLATTGATFDQNESAIFPVSGVIPGFAEGLKLVKPGGRIRLCIPAELGYGDQAAGDIPANSDLVFEVGLQSVDRVTPPMPLAAAEKTCPVKTKSGLSYAVVSMGTGPKPDDGSVVLIGYEGFLASDGTRFDANKRAPIPVADVVPGFSEGLKVMQKGGSYRLCIPAALGYGDKPTGPIPAKSDLIFRVTLIDFKSLSDVQAQQRPVARP